MFDEDDERSTWEKLPADVSEALSAVLDSKDVPPRALALYARWWQLETWLRELTYVELRSQHGMDWPKCLPGQVNSRQERDKQYEYMASPDWQNPLSYLDASKLLDLIDENWTLFEPVLPAHMVWVGRRHELISIRNRIGHLRRPHKDDLVKLEQTLRDLEHGAFRALAAYNRWLELPDSAGNDPIVNAFRNDDLEDATGLIEHSELRYNMGVRLSYTRRPWNQTTPDRTRISGTPGLLWSVGLYPRLATFDLSRFWRDLSSLTRQLLLHVLVPDPGHLDVTFPAVDDSRLVNMAVGDVLKAAMGSVRGRSNGEYTPWTPTTNVSMDSRIQINTVWTFVDDSTVPISLFSAGGGGGY